ncbi:MAG: DNA polymerase I, partial [Patescibacteria group bacterium]
MLKEKQRFIIIDGNAIIHRAYHALPPMTAKDGTMVNAVYGFTSMLLKVINDLKPTHLAVSFDVAGPTFRDKLYADYKATRVKADQDLYDQIPLCYQIVEAFGIPIYTKEGFEADDVIGTITKKLETGNLKLDIEAIIVTGDKDMLQLVENEKVEVYLLRKGMSDYHLFDEKKVKEEFGFGPEMIVDYKALRGDASDNIPGVKGIGEKTATELITKIGGVEDIYRKIERLKDYKISDSVIKKLEDGKRDAEMSKKLATIDTDVKGLKFSLDDCETGRFDAGKIEGMLKKFEFFSLLKRIPGASVENKLQVTSYKLQNESRKKIDGGIEIEIIKSADEVKKLANEIKKAGVFACKEIVSGKNIIEGKFEGLVFVVDGNSYFVDGRFDELAEIFTDQKILLIGHDLKQLIKVLQCNNETMKQCNNLFDTMIASYVLNSSTRAHDLKAIIMRELGKDLPGSSDQASLFGVNPKIAAEELILVLQVYQKYDKQLSEMEDKGLFEKIEMALIPVLAEMELNGVAVDKEMLGRLSKEVVKDIDKVTKKIWQEAGEEFNVSSPVQLRDVLFEKMGLPAQGIKKGKTGYSTASPELEKLRGAHPIVELIEEYRELEKLRNTYIDVLPNLINKKTGRIHTTFNQAVTTTGRLSSSDPNLQNIPIKTELGREIRKAFLAEKGYCLVVADYSQIELRIVASLAEDKIMMEIFERGEDIHQATAAAINGVGLDKVTKEMRSAAKAVNFGVLYGMGSYGLSWRAGISQSEAREFIAKYF